MGWAVDIEERLAALAPYDVMQDAVKARICGQLDGVVVNGADPESVVETCKILNSSDYPIHAAANATNFESARDNYGIVQRLFKDTLAVNLTQDQNKRIFGKKKF